MLDRKLGILLALFLVIIFFTFAEEEDAREVEFEPITVEGFAVATTVEQSINQGVHNFSDDELAELLPELNRDVRGQNFTFYLEMVDMQLNDEDIASDYIPIFESDLVTIDTEGTAIFEEITFHHAGVYTFRVRQLVDLTTAERLGTNVEAGAYAVYNWEIDERSFDFVVTVTEDEEDGVLRANIQQEDVVFVNEFTLFIEDALAPLRVVLGYDDVGFEMYSEYALLINLSSGEVLFDHQADVRTYPASVTKMMTVLVGLEHGNMDDEVVVEADFEGLFFSQAAQAGFEYGEVRTFSEIIHGVLLPSGGDATEALANHIAGSYEDFVGLMNIKALELGMFDTHFVTATGLHDDNHYTTAYDIAILMEYGFQNPVFREMFVREAYELEEPNLFGYVMYSTFNLFAPTTVFDGGEILGGRTGFTIPAGRCLASLATNGEDEFILITFGAMLEDGDDSILHILDALTIYEYFLGGEE